MKKVGIITITDYTNYGNRLQNYAAQEILKKYNLEVYTIKTEHPKLVNLNRKKGVFEFLKRNIDESPLTLLNKVKIKISDKRFENIKNERITKFKEFSSCFLKETQYSISDLSIPESAKSDFDYYVIGSDQIWNPTFRLNSMTDFAMFADREKCIALSPSIGISKLPEESVEKYKKYLNHIKYLSVREEAGRKIIFELTGKEVPVFIDPTLMLPKEYWKKLKKPLINKPNSDYIVQYTLGELNNEQKKVVKKISKDYGLKIIQVGSLSMPQYYTADPGEFLDLIESASLIITDSFHGSIFSILFERPFVVLARSGDGINMNSRIDTLLQKLNLQNRHWDTVINRNTFFEIDYIETEIILENERTSVDLFLSDAFQSKTNTI